MFDARCLIIRCGQIKSVVMIDCGATVDLAELLSLSPELIVYLLDSHRPYSLFNIFGNSQVGQMRRAL